jgi:hypothetical protein
MTVASAADLKTAFPTATLTPLGTLTEPPTYATIHQAQVELNGNARSVHSNGGDGILGHLALTVSPARYQVLSTGNVAFVPPVNPTLHPVHPVNATAPQISEANRQHLVQQQTFQTYTNVDAALRSQLIEATPTPYLAAIRHADLGFGGLTCLQLLNHLHDSYAIITAQDLEDNLVRMLAPWNPPTPLEILFTQIEDGAFYADAGGDPVSDAFQARKIAAILFDSGRFPVDHREWRAKPTAEQTLANVKTHFRKADLDRRKLELTSSSAGYHGAANHIATMQAKQQEFDNTKTENALLRALLAQHAEAVPSVQLSDDTSVAMSTLTALQASQTTASETLAALLAAQMQGLNTTTRPPLINGKSFCWTHGFTSNVDHFSASCQHKAEGHQDAATGDNQMGGNPKVWTRARPA